MGKNAAHPGSASLFTVRGRGGAEAQHLVGFSLLWYTSCVAVY